jgi:hypothetical protein
MSHNLLQDFPEFIPNCIERAAVAVSDNSGDLMDGEQSLGTAIRNVSEHAVQMIDAGDHFQAS